MASETFRYDVFISYSHHDSQWVRGWLVPGLRQAGLEVCVDYESFELGAPSLTEMERGVVQSRKTLPILTPAYLASEWCEFENILAQALSTAARRRRVIPLLLEPCDPPPRIAMLTYAYFTQAEDQERELQRVVAAIKGRGAAPGVAAEIGSGLMPLPPQPYFVPPHPLQENFTGRVREREMLADWLTRGAHPVLALIAIGGMGKSALTWVYLQRDVLGLPVPGVSDDPPGVADVCRVSEAARPEGVLWWSFYEREATFATFLSQALTYASGGRVNLADIPSTFERVRTLVTLLQQRPLLLVLDGFERELRAYASLSAAYQGDAVAEDDRGEFRACTDPHAADFLRQVAPLSMPSRVLLTSRLFPRELEGLAGCRCEDLTAMDPEDAVAFFEAQGVRGTRAEIQGACEPYGYHPLALCLLAGVIVKDRQAPGDVQVAGRYPVEPALKGKEQHHILDVAYDTLDRTKRALLSRIAAFRSPMTYDALSIFNPYRSEKRFSAALDELTDRGLLFFDREHARYDLHPIVRQHAYDRLADKRGVHSRLRDYFAAVPAPEEETIRSVDDLAKVIELYHHTVGAGRYDEAQDMLRDRLIPDPLYFRFGAYQRCIELLEALFPDGEDHPPRLKDEGAQAWTLNALANSCDLSGQPRRAVPLYEMQIALREKRDEKRSVAIGLGNLADTQVKFGELAAAETNVRRRIELCREIEDALEEAVGHQDLGWLLARRGAFDEAAQELDSALAAFTEQGESQSQCVVWAYRARRALLMGDPRAALENGCRARELADEVARKRFPVERDFVRAEWLLGAALVALASEDKPRQDEFLTPAEGHLTEALTRCRRINMVDHEPDILLAWACWHHLRGDMAQARDDAQKALSIADRCEYRLKQAEIHNFLARLSQQAGDAAAAREHARIARERAWCDGPPHCYKPALDEADRLLSEVGATP